MAQVDSQTGGRARLDRRRLWALRAAEVGVLAATWLFLMGLWMPCWTLFGTPGLGVSFPYWPVLIVDVAVGFVAQLLCAARAWNHQPAIFSWLTGAMGAATVIVGVLFSAGLYQSLTIAAGGLLLVSSIVSAIARSGPIFEVPPLSWAGHPEFASGSPAPDRPGGGSQPDDAGSREHPPEPS